ncbi:MAG: flagellar motor protein MotB [Planctomycetota bacterium]|nr:flagellar motor protein MotB [Planctomycetota bacterium]
MSSISRGLLLLLVASITAGCQTTSLERELAYNQDKLRATEEQRDRLEFQLAASERDQQGAISELVTAQQRMADISAKNAALAAENEMLMARPIPSSALLVDVGEPDLGGFDGIDGLKAASDGGTVTLTLDQQVLFNSGSAEISKRGHQSLIKLAEVLHDQFAGREIHVEGHTDSTPVKKTKSLWATNWELSSTRACSVLRELISANAADTNRIAAVGYGAQRPIADNSTKQGRSQNRRVEVIVFPAG